MFCGISKAEFLKEDAPKLEQWLGKGYQGKMKYMENHFDMRLDPTKLVPGAKSIISLAFNYFPGNEIPSDAKIARYAWGEDYHDVLKEKLKNLVSELKNDIGDFDCRVFTDSAPIMERQWAAKSGLGWIGKNSLLLNKKEGSYFFLAEIICDLHLDYDVAVKDHCGTCTACIDACPTEAIIGNQLINANKCISYLTIELKESISPDFAKKLDGWVFGCDICQEVCPWNKFSKKHNESAFMPLFKTGLPDKKEWIEMTEEIFKKSFKKSAIKRAGLLKIKQSVQFIINN